MSEADHIAGLSTRQLVNQWRNFVQEVLTGYDWCIDEYLNDASLRGIIEGRMQNETLSGDLLAELCRIDALFLEATELCEHDSLSRFDEWQRRLPKKPIGSLADDVVLLK